MKRYLTGIDWVINSIDYIGKTQSGIGNISQVIIELEGQLNSEILQEKLRSFLSIFPLVNGFTSRAANLCPYWKIPSRKRMPPVKVTVAHLEDNANYLSYFEAQVNKPFSGEQEHLVFNLVSAGKKSFLGLTFDHRILDARGAETLLDIFQQYYQNGSIPEVAYNEPPHLNHWKEKFKAGQQVNRKFIGLTADTPRTLKAPPKNNICKFKIINFNNEETRRFIDTAYKKGGYLMLMPYALAKTITIMHRIFESKNMPETGYIIPISVDTRAQEAARRELFFNHVSFLFFKINTNMAGNFPELLANIKEQMYEQVKTAFPEALKEASMLLRIAPLPLVNFFVQLMSKKKFASFSFSLVNSAYLAPKLATGEVTNIFHLPRVPNPPGIGVFFNQFNEKINATLSYFDGILDEKEAEQVAAGIKAIGNET